MSPIILLIGWAVIEIAENWVLSQNDIPHNVKYPISIVMNFVKALCVAMLFLKATGMNAWWY